MKLIKDLHFISLCDFASLFLQKSFNLKPSLKLTNGSMIATI